MDYSKYKQSRDFAWQILLDHEIRELPVKVSSICKALGVKIISYEKGKDIIEAAGLRKQCENNDGFTFHNVIFYNQGCTVGRQRFTIAHELGHIIMHTEGLYNREPSTQDDPIEHEANVFASRLLAPACVLWGLGVTTPEQISEICGISITAAEFRMDRLKILYERKKFLVSPLERRVYEQFITYIKEHRL